MNSFIIGTGEPVGGTVTLGEVVLGFFSILRAKQLKRDAPSSTP